MWHALKIYHWGGGPLLIHVRTSKSTEDDGPIEPHPILCEVLKAISTMGKYTNDLNDPFAQKIEALLGLFTRQFCFGETRHMENADFFK